MQKAQYVSKKVRFISVLLVTLVLLVNTAIPASANWHGYYSTSFLVRLPGTARDFDSGNIGCYAYTYNSSPNSNPNGSISITLYRGNTAVGTKYVSRKAGYIQANFYGLKPGNYRFEFGKANDGTRQYLTELEFYSF